MHGSSEMSTFGKSLTRGEVYFTLQLRITADRQVATGEDDGPRRPTTLTPTERLAQGRPGTQMPRRARLFSGWSTRSWWICSSGRCCMTPGTGALPGRLLLTPEIKVRATFPLALRIGMH